MEPTANFLLASQSLKMEYLLSVTPLTRGRLLCHAQQAATPQAECFHRFLSSDLGTSQKKRRVYALAERIDDISSEFSKTEGQQTEGLGSAS